MDPNAKKFPRWNIPKKHLKTESRGEFQIEFDYEKNLIIISIVFWCYINTFGQDTQKDIKANNTEVVNKTKETKIELTDSTSKKLF